MRRSLQARSWPWRAVRDHCQRGMRTASFQIQGSLTETTRGSLPLVGAEGRVLHTFRLADTKRFAEINGDDNPIHTDAQFAKREADADAPIVQGLLSASLFATIFGRTCPGCLYVSQQLHWRARLLVDEEICAQVRVVSVRKRFVECETSCEKTSDGTIVVQGQATVYFPRA